jgi:D-alanyl-lipoteichoic acid acyltransferase DltB (MBOAT superfamily)
MVLGGLWHGAAINFILWGGYQGLLLCGHRLLTGRVRELLPSGIKPESDAPPSAPHRFVKQAINLCWIGFFFLFVCYGWLLFRANSFDQIIHFTGRLVGLGPTAGSIMARPPLAGVAGFALLLVLQLVEWIDGRRDCYRHWPRPLQGLFYAALIFILAMGTSNAPAQFIYFQF